MFVTGDDYSNDASTYPLYPQSSAKHKTLLQLDAAKILGICQETKANTCRLLSSSYMQCIKEIRDVCLFRVHAEIFYQISFLSRASENY